MQLIIELTIPILIGIFLGLLGGGGTTLAVPALVFIFGFETKIAIAISLFVVGVSSLLTSIVHFYKKNIRLLCTLVFGGFGSLGSFLSAKFIAPQLSDDLQLLLFAVLILMVAVLMFNSKKHHTSLFADLVLTQKCILSSISGITIGVITGIIGVGGGFLIVPALIYLMNLTMIEAVANSLLIIALQSLSAYLAYAQYLDIPIDFALKFTILVIPGSFLGTFVAVKVKQDLLKKIFAILLFIMASFIIVQKFS